MGHRGGLFSRPLGRDWSGGSWRPRPIACSPSVDGVRLLLLWEPCRADCPGPLEPRVPIDSGLRTGDVRLIWAARAPRADRFWPKDRVGLIEFHAGTPQARLIFRRGGEKGE